MSTLVEAIVSFRQVEIHELSSASIEDDENMAQCVPMLLVFISEWECFRLSESSMSSGPGRI